MQGWEGPLWLPSDPSARPPKLPAPPLGGWELPTVHLVEELTVPGDQVASVCQEK